MLDILIVAPHPDDAELGMAGAILRFKSEGRKVGVLDLTDGEPTPHGSPEIRAKETAAATRILGLDWRQRPEADAQLFQARQQVRGGLGTVGCGGPFVRTAEGRAGAFRRCQQRPGQGFRCRRRGDCPRSGSGTDTTWRPIRRDVRPQNKRHRFGFHPPRVVLSDPPACCVSLDSITNGENRL